MRQLSGMDNLFLALEDVNQHMHVGALGIYDPSTAEGGKVRFKGILEFFEKRLSKSKIFRRRLVNLPLGIDRPYWIDCPTIDVEYHIRHIALPKPGDWRQLCIQAARLHARPLDLSMPAWECYVIEGLDNIPGIPAGSFAFYIKIHHAAIDGEAGVELMKAIHSFSSADDAIEDRSAIIADREPSTIELLARTVGHRASMVGDTSRLLLDFGKLGFNFGKNYLERLGQETPAVAANEPKAIPGKAPITRFDQAVSPHRVVEALGLPMREIQEIRSKVHGATVNDVFMAVTGGALRKYLGDKNELPEASLNAMVPMTTRGAKKDEDVGNQVGMSAMPICTDIADPIERLRKVSRGSNKTKQASSSMGKDLPGKLINLLPAVAGKMLITKGLLPLANLTISNVRGPDVPLYLAGAKMVLFLPVSIPMDNLGLNITGFSYNGTLWVCVTVCRQMMPDPAVFAQCYRDSFEELLIASKKLEDEASAKAPAKVVAKARAAGKPIAAKSPAKPLMAKPAATKVPVKRVSKPAAAQPAKGQPATVKTPAQPAPTQPAATKAPVKRVSKPAAAQPAKGQPATVKTPAQPAPAKPAATKTPAKRVSKPATRAASTEPSAAAQPKTKAPTRKPAIQPPTNRPPLKKVERTASGKSATKALGKGRGKASKSK